MANEESQQIKALYEYSATLDKAGTDVAKHTEVYKGILDGARGGPKTKCLAAQLIPRYFKHFPELIDEGINALTDLCEEEDMQIRILAVRAFPAICKDTPSALPKAADILGQLLQTEIIREQEQVKQSLVSLLRVDTKAVINALFNQITNRDESQREKAILFLKDKLLSLKAELLNPHEDVERELADNIKKVLNDVSGEEFKTFLDLLSALKIYQGQNSKELLDLLADQADLKSDFKPTEVDNVERLLTCMHLALPFLQRGTVASGHGFLNYLASKVLPSLDKLSEDHQNRLLQALAEMSPFASADDARILLSSVYTLFKAHVPTNQDSPKLNLTAIESLLFTFHQLGGKAPGAVSALCGTNPVYTGQPSDMVNVEDSTQKLKEFKDRLEFLKQKLDSTVLELTKAVKAFSPEKDKEKHATATTALQTTKNIQELVQPLMKAKPIFLGRQHNIKLSFQKDFKRKASEPNTSNHVPEQQNNGAKRGRGGYQGIYTPPAKRGDAPLRGRGRAVVVRGSNRGNFRGRGRGRF